MYLETIKNGQFICESIDYNSCSRCHRNELKTFIKYKDTILCLNCVDAISINNKPKPILTRMEQDFFKNKETNITIKPNNFNPPLNSPLTRMMQNIFIGDYPPSVDFKILEKISENEFRVVVNNIVCIMTPIHIAREYFKYLSSDDQGYFYKYI
jgi:hypothetical protein